MANAWEFPEILISDVRPMTKGLVLAVTEIEGISTLFNRTIPFWAKTKEPGFDCAPVIEPNLIESKLTTPPFNDRMTAPREVVELVAWIETEGISAEAKVRVPWLTEINTAMNSVSIEVIDMIVNPYNYR